MDNEDYCLSPKEVMRVGNLHTIKIIIIVVSCYALFTQYSLIYGGTPSQTKNSMLQFIQNQLWRNFSVFHDTYVLDVNDTAVMAEQ